MKVLHKHKYHFFYALLVLFILLLLGITGRLGEKVEYHEEKALEVISTVITKIYKDPKLYEYVQVVDSCGPSFEGGCVNVRSAPSVDAPSVSQARNGVIFKVSDKIEKDGSTWYKIAYDEWLRYPERVKGDQYISGDYVRYITDLGNKELTATSSPTTKHIVVDRGEQMLYAYNGDTLFMKEKVSTGIELTPTPRGTFTVFKKTPSRYMQGPIPGISEHPYDLPGVPWNLYFTEQGAVIHGAYWHNNFGRPQSNGCVNVPIASAERLYEWADVGTKVVVKD